MTYSKLQSILPNDEIHYLSDVSSDQPEYTSDNHTYILFEYTIDYWTDTLNRLNSAGIDYSILPDPHVDLDYILIK